jgi:NADH-quinone oxidoreductase subunit J
MILFTILLTLLIFSFALAPIILNNAVYAVLCFIAVFLLISGILLSLGIEFLAFVYAIVYIGAVAVLFLFVVMLLQVSSQYKRALSISWIALLTFFVIAITFKIVKILVQTIQISINIANNTDVILPNNAKVLLGSDLFNNNIAVPSNELYLISHKFYNIFGMLFMETAFILLLALIAVIILTKTILKSNP